MVMFVVVSMLVEVSARDVHLTFIANSVGSLDDSCEPGCERSS